MPFGELTPRQRRYVTECTAAGKTTILSQNDYENVRKFRAKFEYENIFRLLVCAPVEVAKFQRAVTGRLEE